MENKRNIFINLSPEAIAFTPKNIPIKNEFPTRKSTQHGEKLHSKLISIWGKAEKKKTKRENRYFQSYQGTYIEFIIDKSLKYNVSKLEDRRKNIRILNVKDIKKSEKMRYSLIVSLTTEKEDVQLYTEIINLIKVAEEVEIEI